MKRISFEPRREVGFVDAFLRLRLGQDLHDSNALVMSAEHNLDRFGITEEEYGDENMRHKIHGGNIVVMDENAIERLKFRLLVGGDLPVGSGLRSHI